MLEVKDYTSAAEPLLAHLEEQFPEGVCVSDITDNLNRQYVDLVQEGGGVHGVALAGYTYVLEKMGISFMKMAGTSAGSINTLLLNAVNNKEEAELLQLEGKFYGTRSEKVLEHLSQIDLRDFVDGPPIWRKVILGIFSPAFKQKGIKGIIAQYKNWLIIAGVCLLLMVVAGFVLAYSEDSEGWGWVFGISFAGFGLIAVLLVVRIFFLRKLYNLVEKFGINPGDKFESWIMDILRENKITSVDDLNEKLKREKEALQPRFASCNTTPVPEADFLDQFAPLFARISDPEVKIELLYDELCHFYDNQKHREQSTCDIYWAAVINAFSERLAKDKVITKELVIVSSDITHGLKVEFPGMHKMYWGNDTSLSPARYVRASMSVPVFFRPMEVKFQEEQAEAIAQAWAQMLKVKNKPQMPALFVDGGLLSNFPINVFYSATTPVPRKPTFGIKLEYENEVDSRTINTMSEFGGSMLSTMRYFYDRDFALKQDLYKKTVRSIDTGKVHWLNFNLTDEEKMELFFRGALAATIFLSRYKISEEKMKELISLGEKVPMGEKTFSIFGKGPVEFKTEDALVENIAFEWQSYKIERLLDVLSKQERKDELKGGASMETL
jgi:NTE family protein